MVRSNGSQHRQKPRTLRHLGAQLRSVRWAALVVSTGLLASTAAAQSRPTVWSKIADRDAYARYQLHQSVRDKIAANEDSVMPFETMRSYGYEAARIELEDADVEKLDDPVLLFDYGEVLEALDEHQKAITVLRRALELAPDHQAATEAHLTLAFAYAKTDQSENELEEYRAYLRTARRTSGHATAALNMAEAEMRLGRLDAAVRGYHEALRIAGDTRHETTALACYGLAVALDRQGDTAQSRVEIARALSIDAAMYLITASPNVFFVPSYERYYYVGLGFEARARDVNQPPAQRHVYARRAESAFRSYVAAAQPTDRWTFRVKEHLTELPTLSKQLPPANAQKPAPTPSRILP